MEKKKEKESGIFPLTVVEGSFPSFSRFPNSLKQLYAQIDTVPPGHGCRSRDVPLRFLRGLGGPAPSARDMPHYVPKEDIKPPQTIYEPDMSQGSEGITQVRLPLAGCNWRAH